MSRSKKHAGYRWLLYLCLFCPWILTTYAHAESGRRLTTAAGEQLQTAPVVVNGEVLFNLTGIRAFPATKRAGKAAEIIEEIAEDPSINPDSISWVEDKDVHRIMQDDKQIMILVDADAEYVGLANRTVLATAYVKRISSAIEAYRVDRTANRIQKNLVSALLRSLLLIVVLAAMHWLFKLTNRWMEKYFKRRIKRLEAKSMRMIQSEQIWRVLSGVMKLLKAVTVLGLFYFFLNHVLTLFPWTRYLAKRLLQLAIEPLQSMAVGFVAYLPSLFFLVILFLVIRYLLRLLQSFFDAVHNQNMRFASFEAEWAWPTYRIVRVIILIFAVVIAYPYIPGSSSEAFKGVSLFVGVLLSLGSTSVISNIIAGYTMTYRRAFRIGDTIRVGDTVGKVLESRLLVTDMRSLKNEKIVIPNSTMLNSEITNYTTLAKSDGLILHTQVGIGYEVPWRQVEAMLIEAANRTDGLLKEPKPFVMQKTLTDFAVTYELNVYSKDDSKMMHLYSELHRNIQDVFNEYEVQIMTPHYVADTPEAKLVLEENWYTPPANRPEPRET